MMRPPFETFKRATCRGSYLLGSACGNCEKCMWERSQISQSIDLAEEVARCFRQANNMRAALEEIVLVASGKNQVAQDDTEGMAWIVKFARAALEKK